MNILFIVAKLFRTEGETWQS